MEHNGATTWWWSVGELYSKEQMRSKKLRTCYISRCRHHELFFPTSSHRVIKKTQTQNWAPSALPYWWLWALIGRGAGGATAAYSIVEPLEPGTGGDLPSHNLAVYKTKKFRFCFIGPFRPSGFSDLPTALPCSLLSSVIIDHLLRVPHLVEVFPLIFLRQSSQ